MSDRYEMAREFARTEFKLKIMRCRDLEEVQKICMLLFDTNAGLRKMIQQMMKQELPKLPRLNDQDA